METARRQISFEARIPLSFDLSWPLHSELCEFRGLGAVRVHTSRPAVARYSLDADTVTTVVPAQGSAVTLSLSLSPGAPAVAGDCMVGSPQQDDPLLAALCGSRPLDWMRAILHGTGSPAWASMARKAAVWPNGLDRILALWRDIPAGAEAALWRCAGDAEAFDAIVKWVDLVNSSQSSEEILAELRRQAVAPGFISSPAAEWLHAAAGFPLPLIGGPAAFSRLRGAAEQAARLLDAGLNAGIVLSLQRIAETGDERERLCPALTRAILARRRYQPALQELCREVYAEAQSAAATLCAGRLAQCVDPHSARWPLAEATFDLAQENAVRLFSRALAGDIAAFDSAPGVTPSASLLHLAASAPVVVALRLPLFAKRLSTRVIPALAESGIRNSAGQLEVRLPHAAGGPQSPGLAFLERALLAPFRAVAREPGCTEPELAFEDSFPMDDGAPDLHLRSLLQWLAIPVPDDLPHSTSGRLRISIPQAWTEVWQELPHSRDDAFAPVYSSIASSIHTAMRKWTPYLALKSIDAYAEPAAVLPLLAYAVSDPLQRNGKDRLTRSATGAAAVRRTLETTANRLPALLEQVHQTLLAAEHRSHRSYVPARTSTYLANAYRQRNVIVRLLAMDSFLIEEILHLADLAVELRSQSASPRAASKIFLKSMESARVAIKRYYRKRLGDACVHALPAILWIEATAAACRAMGAIAPISASVGFSTQRGEQSFHNPAALGLQ